MELLGLDIGTSGCKATIINVEGRLQAQAYKEYALFSPCEGYQELNPDLVFASVCEVIKKTLTQHRGDQIKAISVSSFGEAVIPIDRQGQALHNGIIYIDPRGIEEAQGFKEAFGSDRALSITGASIHSMYSLFKILWLKKHRRDIYEKTWKFMLFADYILFKLGAKPHTDYSLAARTMAFDVVNKRWSSEILNSALIDEEKFAEPVQSGTLVGEITPAVAKELGLPNGVLLAAGGHDQPCAALGAGVLYDNIAVDGLGTVECVTPAFDRPVISHKMAQCSFACVPHVKKDMYVTYAFTFTCGGLLKWYRDNFGLLYQSEADRTGSNIYTTIIENASPDPSGLFLLPHFAGAATPYMDTEAKGMIVGLTINTKPRDIAKAILEGITFEMMINLEKLREAGIAVNELRAVGGLARSDPFLQLKADMMGKKVVSLDVTEAGTLGVAMLAGTACGIYKSLETAAEQLVHIKKEYHPNEKLGAIYREKFEDYKRLYPAMKSIYR